MNNIIYLTNEFIYTKTKQNYMDNLNNKFTLRIVQSNPKCIFC